MPVCHCNCHRYKSKSIGWIENIQKLLRPFKDPAFTFACSRPSDNPPSQPYLAGQTWKAELVKSVFSDILLGVHSPLGSSDRRILRFEYNGIGGLILYDMEVLRSLIYNKGRDVEEILGKTSKGPPPTLIDIFGDPDDPEQGGIEVDELLDIVSAKLIYIPLYACTSFVTGLALSAMLFNPLDEPQPAGRDFGFGVSSFGLNMHFDAFRSAVDMSKYLRSHKMVSDKSGKSACKDMTLTPSLASSTASVAPRGATEKLPCRNVVSPTPACSSAPDAIENAAEGHLCKSMTVSQTPVPSLVLDSGPTLEEPDLADASVTTIDSITSLPTPPPQQNIRTTTNVGTSKVKPLLKRVMRVDQPQTRLNRKAVAARQSDSNALSHRPGAIARPSRNQSNESRSKRPLSDVTNTANRRFR